MEEPVEVSRQVLIKINAKTLPPLAFTQGEVKYGFIKVVRKVYNKDASDKLDKAEGSDSGSAAVTLMQTVQRTEGSRVGLILGSDVNAHRTLWSSSDINERGETLAEYLLGTKLVICNKGNEPTFITKNGKEVLDVTFASGILIILDV